MEQKIIKIKCPSCGAKLSVKDEPGLMEKSTTCPICKQKSRIRDFERVVEKRQDATELPTELPQMGTKSDETETVVGSGITGIYKLGKLTLYPNGPIFRLKPGRQTVGRKHTEGTHADFEIETQGKRMSRLHLLIEVKKVVGKGFVHYVSLYGQKANATYIGNNQLEAGDIIELNSGDIIRLPDMPDIRVKFEIEDSEETQIDPQ